MKKSLLVIGILAIAAAMSSCGGNANNSTAPADTKPATEQSAAPASDAPKADDAAAKPATTTQSVDLTKKYVCPNRDGSSDQPGVCEACGMDLIEN